MYIIHQYNFEKNIVFTSFKYKVQQETEIYKTLRLKSSFKCDLIRPNTIVLK